MTDFRLLLGVNLHEAQGAEVEFDILPVEGGGNHRYVLRISVEGGVQLGERFNSGHTEPRAAALPLPAARSSTQYREVRIERISGRWWVFFAGQLVGSVPVNNGPVLNEFRLTAKGGMAWFSDLEASKLIVISGRN